MTQSKSTVTGLAVALFIGAGGGVLLGPFSAVGASNVSKLAPPPDAIDRVTIERVEGDVEVLVADGVWRRTRSRDAVTRPTAVRTLGPDSRATIVHQGTRLIVGQDAVLVIGGRQDAILELSSGHVLAYAKEGAVRVSVPAHQATVSGEAFGVWSRPEALVAAALDGTLTLANRSGLSKQYAKGKEVTVTARGDVPVPLASRLQLEVVSVAQRGRRFAINGKAPPSSVLLFHNGAKVERVNIASPAGTFLVESEARDPAPGVLVAYDAVGRRAELSRPSATLDEVFASLSGGAEPKGEGTPPPPPSEPEAPPVAKVEPEVKKEAPARPVEARRAAPPVEAAAPPPPAPKPEPRRAERTEQAEAPPPKPVEPKPAKAAGKEPKEVKGEGGGRGHSPDPVPVNLFPKAEEKKEEAPAPKPKKDEGKKKDDGVELQWE